MDAVLNLLRQRLKDHPQWFRSQRIAFLDAMLTQVWTAKYSDFLRSEPNPNGGGKLLPPGALNYYSGEYPPYCHTNKMWGLEVDDLYAPLHVNGDHWVALWISIPNRHIVVWDSIPKHVSDEYIEGAVEPIAVMCPYLLRELAAAEVKDTYPQTKFTHERVTKGVPKNKKPGDCGVYALKYIECHAVGLPFPATLCDANIPSIREKLATDLYHDISCRGPNEEDYLNAFDLYEGSTV